MSEVEKKLSYIFGLTNDWLRFAEAKNGALFAFSSASAMAVLSLTPYSTSGLSNGGALFLYSSVLLMWSALLCLKSFLPQTNPKKVLSDRKCDKPSVEDNLYFFGHIQKYSPNGLAQAIAERYCLQADYTPQDNKSDVDLAAQAIINARIASGKYSLFVHATRRALLGILAAMMGIMLPYIIAVIRILIKLV
ncbi:MAG: DUF5706 domain-containing protein [Armatimonadota bacterium]|nr:DUF5706 domain-containing protein [Armatimonadota bacterium]